MKPYSPSRPCFLGLAAALVTSTQAVAAPPPAAPPASPPAAATGDARPVTLGQFKESIRVIKNMVDRFDKLELRLKQEGSGAGGGAKGASAESMDLANLDLSAGSGTSTASPVAAPGGGGEHPGFKVFVDLALQKRPGVNELTFDSFHQFLLFELIASPEVQFSMEVNSSPKYFELDYQITPKLQLRAGKIWVPFDDMAPHNVFGGRVNVSRLAPSGSTTGSFLPDLFTDYGVGMKYQLVDKRAISMVGDLYVLNGFVAGGNDPRYPALGSGSYPSFSDKSSSTDNNADKAVGGRLHTRLWGKWGVGFSFQTGRWTAQTRAPHRYRMTGFDSQLRFAKTEFRTGLCTMDVSLPAGAMKRAGLYMELGQSFGKNRAWKVLGRGGTLQLDDRVFDVTDQNVVGGSLLWKPGLIQYSLEGYKDLKLNTRKTNYSFMAARIVVAL